MKGLRRLLALALFALAMSFGARASALPPDFGEAREHVQNARRDGHYSFCKKPAAPMGPRQRALCPLAEGVEGCEGFAAACKGAPSWTPEEKKEPESGGHVLSVLGSIAKGLVWILLAIVVAAIAIPLLRLLLKAQRDRAIADKPPAPNVATPAARPPPPPPEEISDAEAALREADEHARRGELARALSLYLAASLAALDRRGAIRLARHRTNGEYVRACAEDASRQPLREIVREVDKVEFGKVAPSGESVARVASRATNVVRAAGVPRAAPSIVTGTLTILVLLMALLVAGCSDTGSRPGDTTSSDPAGDQLPIDVLRRSGFEVGHLRTSLAALPIPGSSETAPIVAVDVPRVTIEDETVAHLLRWVDEGGVLVLFGEPESWPKELHVTTKAASTNLVDVVSLDVYARGAHVATTQSLEWPSSEGVAFIGANHVYAAHVSRGKGVIIGVAGDDLFTNVGVARPDNAAAFVALFHIAMNDRRDADATRGISPPAATVEIRVARGQDGIAPASNPFSALVQAGLGKGAWHALAAALVLFLAFGIRHSRARPAAPAARRAFAEHVQATGAFYGRARALGHALASYGRFAEMRLRERVPRGADPVQFLAARASVSPEEAGRVWKRATEAKADDPPRGDELATIRDLGAMLAKALDTKL